MTDQRSGETSVVEQSPDRKLEYEQIQRDLEQVRDDVVSGYNIDAVIDGDAQTHLGNEHQHLVGRVVSITFCHMNKVGISLEGISGKTTWEATFGRMSRQDPEEGQSGSRLWNGVSQLTIRYC